ncbi:MAG: hypothetical protein E7365_04465 [Clostridiales bacterium]|nr:hypothetical protein [Clostridiales bacterium]
MKKIFLILLCLILIFTGCSKNNKNTATGSVNFTVLDGFSGLPVENVKIVVPEGELIGYTDSLGKCSISDIPVIFDQRYPIKQGYGTFSVLGYKEGYNDYALFFAQINEQQERNIKIYMFKTDTPFSSGTPLSTIESPNNDWVKDILEKYRK